MWCDTIMLRLGGTQKAVSHCLPHTFRLPLDWCVSLKACTKCKAEKPKAEFPKRKLSSDGLHPNCRICVAAYLKKWSTDNKDKRDEARRAWAKANPDKVAACYKAHKEANPEKHAQYQKKYREANREKTIAATRSWQSANKERVASVKSAWDKANPDKVNAYLRQRRARKLQVDGTHTAADVRWIFDSQRGLCASCEKKLFKSGKKKFHVDHIRPLSRGGSDEKYNLQCLCPGCNLSKHAKDPLDWAKENGKLL